MKKSIAKFFLMFLLINFITINKIAAQTNNSFEITKVDFFNQLHFQKIYVNSSQNNITGSPYEDTNFYIGTIITKDSLVFKGVNLRYNNYKDVIEFRKNESEIYQIPKQFPVLQVKIADKVFEQKYYLDKHGENFGYFQRLTNGKVALFCQNKVILEKAKMASLYSESKLPNYKLRGSVWYIEKNHNCELESFSNKKEFIRLFDNKEMEAFIKKNKINIKKETDLIRALNYYNSVINWVDVKYY